MKEKLRILSTSTACQNCTYNFTTAAETHTTQLEQIGLVS